MAVGPGDLARARTSQRREGIQNYGKLSRFILLTARDHVDHITTHSRHARRREQSPPVASASSTTSAQ